MEHMRNQLFACILMAVFICPAIVLSQNAVQEKTFPSAGNNEIGGNASYQYVSTISSGTEVATMNSLSITPYIGHFFSDEFELGFNPLSYQRMWHSNYSVNMLTVLIAPAYYFPAEGSVHPFIEAQAGYTTEIFSTSYYTSISQTFDGFSWGGRAGIKCTVAGHGLLNLALQYQQLTYTISGSDTRSGSNLLSVSAGFTIWY